MLYLEGWNQTQIADELGRHQSTISRDLKVIQEEWAEAAILDLNEIKQRELTKLDQLEREYLDAWRRSKEPIRKTTIKGRGKGEAPDTMERTTTTEYQVGDARYLDGALKCVERRCRLLGIDAPTDMKIGVSGGLEIDDERVRAAIERLERS